MFWQLRLFRAVESNRVAIGHRWLFKLKLIKSKWNLQPSCDCSVATCGWGGGCTQQWRLKHFHRHRVWLDSIIQKDLEHSLPHITKQPGRKRSLWDIWAALCDYIIIEKKNKTKNNHDDIASRSWCVLPHCKHPLPSNLRFFSAETMVVT